MPMLPAPVLHTYFMETVKMDCDSLMAGEETVKTPRANLKRSKG